MKTLHRPSALLASVIALLTISLGPETARADQCTDAYRQCVAAAGAEACAGLLSGCKDAKSGKLERNAKKNQKMAQEASVNTGAVLELGLEGKQKAESIDVKHTCDGKLTLDGESISASKGVAIVATGDCRLTLNKVKIKAKRGIVVEGNAQITLQDSSIDASEIALSVSGNASVRLLGKSSLKGKKFAVMAEDDANVTLDAEKSSKIKGKVKVPATSTINKNYTPTKEAP